MKKHYILTGYDTSKDKMSTNMFNDLEVVYSIIDNYSHDALFQKYKGSINDFNFDIASRRSHNGAVIINDNMFKWSIFQFEQ